MSYRRRTSSQSLPQKGSLPLKGAGGLRAVEAPEDSQQDQWNCRQCESPQPVSATHCDVCGGRLPVIALFTANLQRNISTERIHLKWEVFEADSVRLMPGNMIVPPKGELELRPDWQDTEVFSLIASNGIGGRQLSTRVAASPPRIVDFSATETRIQIGYPIILQWDIEHARTIEIDQGIGDVTGQSFVEVYPEKAGIVTLTARNEAGEVRRSIELELPKPEILHFTASNFLIQAHIPLQLSWDVNNASEVRLEPEPGDVRELTHLYVQPDRTTLYTLIASNDSGSISQSIRLTLPPPNIRFFGAEDPISIEGKPVELRWEVEHAYRMEIDPGIGAVDATGSVKVKPTQSRTEFTLRAYGHSGEVAQSFTMWRFPIPLEEELFFLEESLLAIPPLPTLSVPNMKPTRDPIPDSLQELEALERRLQVQQRQKLREMRIQRAKEVQLTDDLLHLRKAKLRDELRKWFHRLRTTFSSKT